MGLLAWAEPEKYTRGPIKETEAQQNLGRDGALKFILLRTFLLNFFDVGGKNVLGESGPLPLPLVVRPAFWMVDEGRVKDGKFFGEGERCERVGRGGGE